MFAIVRIGGKQYKVDKGNTIFVDRLGGKDGDVVKFDEVLLVSDDGKTKVGSPTVKGETVKAKILSQEKGEKIDVRRFHAKVRERKHRGFRALLTKLEILDIAHA